MPDITRFIQDLDVEGGAHYEIKVRGKLISNWSDWFENLSISNLNGITVLSGYIADQSALQGILSKLLDFNLKLLSVRCIDAEDGIFENT